MRCLVSCVLALGAFAGALVAVTADTLASSCGDLRQEVTMAERFYRDWKVYINESESDLAEASHKNLQHSLDLAALDLSDCSDKASLLEYYRVKLVAEADPETEGWAVFANSFQHGQYDKYYAGLKADFNRATALGLRHAYPSDYAALKSAIAKSSPAAWAKVNKKVAADDARYTSQAQADLFALTGQYPTDGWQHVTSVVVKNQWTYTYVVDANFWHSLSDMSRDDVKSGLKTLAEKSYENSHCGNKPYEVGLTVDIADENGASLDTEFPQPDPTPFMQTPAPCSR
jgi:hypothetical protein